MQYDDCSVSQVSSLSSCVPSASPHTRSAEIKASAPSSSGRTCWRMESHLVLGASGVSKVLGMRRHCGHSDSWPSLKEGESVSMGNASPGTRAAFAITNRLNMQMLEETESLCRASGTLPLLYRNKCCWSWIQTVWVNSGPLCSETVLALLVSGWFYLKPMILQ